MTIASPSRRRALGLGLGAGLGTIVRPAFARTRDLKIALASAEGDPQFALARAFVESLVEVSRGELTATLFPGGRLGSEQRTVEETAKGLLDATIVTTTNLQPFSPSAGALDLPYLVESLEEAERLVGGEFGRRIADDALAATGLRIVAWGHAGFRVLTNSKRPVTTLEELRELRVRVPSNAIMAATYEAWGVEAVPMYWPEVLAALEDRVVDGQDNPWLSVLAAGFGAVQDHATDLRHFYSASVMLVSEPIFQSLSAEDRKLVLAAGFRATRASADFLRDREAAAREALVAGGMAVSELAGGAGERMAELARERVWPRFADEVGRDVLGLALAELGRDGAPIEAFGPGG